MKITVGSMARHEIITRVQKIHVGLIMIQVCVKIGMIQDTVFLETVAFICMIVLIIKMGGNWRKILKNHNDKDGKEL